jgi:carbamoyl-phosphate synthase small subunit
MRGMIAEGTEPTEALQAELLASPSMAGLDLASRATTPEPYGTGEGPLVIAYDFGMKRNIVRMLEATGLRVEVMPATTPPAEALARNPDGIFLSNGPGDPDAIPYAKDTVRALASSGVPTFGICLGHQLLGLAFGGRTDKLAYGHRGGNHPVKELETGKVLITTQNHGFAVVGGADGIPGAPDLAVTHLNLNDGTVEGLRHRTLPVFAVQYHPEAAPGPHDAYPHFGAFLDAIKDRAGKKSATS